MRFITKHGKQLHGKADVRARTPVNNTRGSIWRIACNGFQNNKRHWTQVFSARNNDVLWRNKIHTLAKPQMHPTLTSFAKVAKKKKKFFSIIRFFKMNKNIYNIIVKNVSKIMNNVVYKIFRFRGCFVLPFSNLNYNSILTHSKKDNTTNRLKMIEKILIIYYEFINK